MLGDAIGFIRINILVNPTDSRSVNHLISVPHSCQVTLKDDSYAIIPKGPKRKEKNFKSYEAEPSEKVKELNITKKHMFQPSE